MINHRSKPVDNAIQHFIRIVIFIGEAPYIINLSVANNVRRQTGTCFLIKNDNCYEKTNNVELHYA
jgi:hypothetical protein